MNRIYLSPPFVTGVEREMLLDAFDSNWIAPLGPHVDAFERELAGLVEVPNVAALCSGTAALHLALKVLGIGSGDEVIVSDLTFAATANPVMYEHAIPVFIDSELRSWNMDPDLLAEELEARAGRGRLPRAVVVVDLYGQCADFKAIVATCRRYDVPLIEDAAEALGATYDGRPAASFGDLSVLSFNGNKIVTTSSGGALVSPRAEWIDQARFLATQARDPAPHYEHSTIGYNYRLSNLLAAVGRGQLQTLSERVARRRRNFEWYKRTLGDLPGIDFMPEPYPSSNRWLTCVTIDPERYGSSREEIRLALEAENIEARPLWKPMHLQPVFRSAPFRGTGVSEMLFQRGLCLPSGSDLRDADLDRIAAIVRSQCRAAVDQSG